ncbi:MAG TPA: hypothetical protein VFL28_16995 [bacterium]|nr:hypothetical protein [bacterium]
MRHVTAIAVSVLLACLALAGTGDAQPAQPIQVQGTIQSVDCQSGHVTLTTAGGSDTFQATNETVAYVNGSSVSFCSLQSYAGDSATAVLIPTGNAFELTQINVTAQTAAPSTSGSLLSNPVAVGIGALLLGGLIGYMVGHHNTQPQTVDPPAGYTQGQPVYSPYGYRYYPAGYAPGWLPAQYPYNRAYDYQGHHYYRCTNGWWNMDRSCEVHER